MSHYIQSEIAIMPETIYPQQKKAVLHGLVICLANIYCVYKHYNSLQHLSLFKFDLQILPKMLPRLL